MIKFKNESEKRQIENLHKLFAVTCALPALLPLTKRLIKLPENDFFYAAFRAWYLVCHMTDVMPRTPSWQQAKEGLQSVFGIYRGTDGNRFPSPRPEPLPIVTLEASAPIAMQLRPRRQESANV